jgi:hypothetical protein
MATDSILGLFTSPQQYQQALQTEALGQGIRMAQLSPLEAGRAMGYAGAAQVGRGLVGALGGEDPALQRVSQQQQILSNVDFTDLRSLTDAARLATAQGRPDIAQALASRALELQTKVEDRQAAMAQQLQIAKMNNDARIEQARIRGEDAKTIAQMQVEGRKEMASIAAALRQGMQANKPLPASLQKDESKDLETIDTYTAQQQALQPAISSLTPNERGVRKLELGPVKNLQYAAQNLAGNSTPESRAYEGLKSAVDTAVNLQVSAEKGVQTDRDVLRFAQALIAAYGRNDSEATLQALKRYNDSLAKAQERTKSRLESRRKSQGVEPYFTGQEQRPQGTMENPIVLK